MTTRNRIGSELTTGGRIPGRQARQHRLPQCTATGLPRYRDRHQARHGARALGASAPAFEIHTFACPDCCGFHLDKIRRPEPTTVHGTSEPTNVAMQSLTNRKRRYVLVDIENATGGARATREEVARFWTVVSKQAPGITSRDHVVVGAARKVARRYRTAIHNPNVRWVVGADAPDGADRALLAAVDLHRVAHDYDELVIISGDHIFAGLARRARSLGLSVHVVTTEHPTQRTMLSHELASVANTRTLVRRRSRALQQSNVMAIRSVADAGNLPRRPAAAA